MSVISVIDPILVPLQFFYIKNPIVQNEKFKHIILIIHKFTSLDHWTVLEKIRKHSIFCTCKGESPPALNRPTEMSAFELFQLNHLIPNDRLIKSRGVNERRFVVNFNGPVRANDFIICMCEMLYHSYEVLRTWHTYIIRVGSVLKRLKSNCLQGKWGTSFRAIDS